MNYTTLSWFEALQYLWSYVCVQPRRDIGDYVYLWGNWENQSDLHDESILPEELDLAQKD